MHPRPQITHDNHYVPQFYLRRWSKDGIHLWVYKTLVSHESEDEWKWASVKSCAFQRDLYTTHIDGKLVDDYERWISSEIENPAIPSVEKAVKGEYLAEKDWENLIRLLGLQDIRTPQSFIDFMSLWEKVVPDLLQSTLETVVKKLSVEGNHTLIQQNQSYLGSAFSHSMNVHVHKPAIPDEKGYIQAEVKLGRTFWVEVQRYIITSTVEELMKHNWCILHPAKGIRWVTSDHPVVKLNYYSSSAYDFKGGWGSSGTEIFMPLSPLHLMYTKIGSSPPPNKTLTPEVSIKIQRFLAEKSRKWIFASERQDEIPILKPRIINSELVRKEQEVWNRWHEEQSKIEL